MNFFRTLNDTHKLRKGMRIIGKKEVKALHNQYNRAIRSAHCLITTDNIILKVRKTDIEEIDTNLKEKFKFSCRSVCQKYSKQYVFSLTHLNILFFKEVSLLKSNFYQRSLP